MKLSTYAFSQSQSIWEAYVEHPFIKEIGEGTLPKEKFEHYLIQDYLYLKEYTKVFAMGMVKARTMKEMKFFFNGIVGTMEDETAVHLNYLKGFGYQVSELEQEEYDLVTTGYTSFMQGICLTGDLKELVVALLPCAWSYNYIGKYLLEGQRDIATNFYGQWIESYGGEEFTALSDEWITYTDELCAGISEEERERLSDIFKKASLFELAFWNMAYAERKQLV